MYFIRRALFEYFFVLWLFLLVFHDDDISVLDDNPYTQSSEETLLLLLVVIGIRGTFLLVRSVSEIVHASRVSPVSHLYESFDVLVSRTSYLGLLPSFTGVFCRLGAVVSNV